MVKVEEDIRYRAKAVHFEQIFGEEQVDSGGHWQEQPLSPDASYFAFTLGERFGDPVVLDEGSGTGRHTVQLSQVGLRVVGVERTINGIEKSRNLVEQMGISAEQVSFRQGDVRTLPFEDGSFDGFHDFCTLSHLHREDWPRYFAEAARVTKPGGLGLIVAFSGYDREFYGVPIRSDDIGWLEFKDGSVHLEGRQSQRYSRPHQYPVKYENMSWWFGTIGDMRAAMGDKFEIQRIHLWDHPETHHKGKRHYLSVLLERK